MGKEGRALLGSLSNDDGKNAIGEDWQNNNFIYTCITLFCTFLCRRCTTTTWKCLISRFNEDVNRRQQLSFSFPELWYSLLRIQLIKIANIWRIKRDGISVIKFEATRIHFLSDVFVAVAVVVASAPYWLHLSRYVSSLDSVARGKTDKGGKRRETVWGHGEAGGGGCK